MENNPELELANNFVQFTHRNIFLTGKAGTGKTTFLHQLKFKSPKRMVVVAPTGVAAINAGGVTIHSFFQMSFGPVLPENAINDPFHNTPSKKKFNRKKIKLIKSLELLVIDEISMVRADLLDGIDQVLRRYKNKYQPFGGIQLLLIGDLQQLSPVVKPEEWNILKNYYESPYFFSSKAFKESNALSIELKHIYRQQDQKFIHILNEIRNNILSAESASILNERYFPNFNPKDEEGYITLTTHNVSANTINKDKLKHLKARSEWYTAEVDGIFPEYSYPTFEELELKIKAQVMFIKNDSSADKRYYNGKIGRITAVDDDVIWVLCENDDQPIEVKQETWQNLKFNINEKTKEIDEEVIGEFKQFPLRLAWAITIHKSQGLTFEKAIIDAQASFAHGQTYVAFSRCKTLEGMVLKSRINQRSIISDQSVQVFSKSIANNQPNTNILDEAKFEYQLFLINELFNFHFIHFLIQKSIKQLSDVGLIFHGNLKDQLEHMVSTGSAPLLRIASNFNFQLKQMLATEKEIEGSSSIQDRIKKAAAYFLLQSNTHLMEPFQKGSFDTDNKASAKQINETLDQLMEELAIKTFCLKSCLNGFEVKKYLDTKAEAILQKTANKKSVSTKSLRSDTDHPELYELLRVWRKSEADDEDKPLYHIATTKSLVQIANFLPATTKQLLNIHGMGKVKVANYGSEILDMVQNYCFDSKISFKKDEEILSPKIPKKSTKEISLDLYLDGNSAEDIAKTRVMSIRTIEGHLAYWIGMGKLNATDFVTKIHLKHITDYLENNPRAKLTDIKNGLDKSISYTEIIYVLKQFESDKLNLLL